LKSPIATFADTLARPAMLEAAPRSSAIFNVDADDDESW
jgi:hypothetical protein